MPDNLPSMAVKKMGSRQCGYRKITLWTNDVLKAARHIYEKAGFRVVQHGTHHSFGHHLVEETWEMEL